MTQRDTGELISFVYEKVAEEEVWDVKIVERRVRRGTEKEVALNREKEFYDETEDENDARIEFTNVFGDFLLAMDEISEQEEVGSADWHWEIGRLLDERDIVSELDNNSHPKLGELIPEEEIDGNTLVEAQKVYELFPEKEDVPDTDRVTMLRKLQYNADSLEDARNVLANAQEEGFIPMNREIRVWKDVKPNPELDEVAREVNRRFPTYEDPSSKVKFVRHVYHLCRIDQHSIPYDDEIEQALREQEQQQEQDG